MRLGVLALQGAFIEHEQALQRLGVDFTEIRQLADLEHEYTNKNCKLDGLIIPGGESTVQGKLLHDLELFQPIQELIQHGMPVFGTCAGLLLLAEKISNDERCHLATMHITAMRNAYGRQLGSFFTEAEFKGLGKIPMTFIRAPYITEVASDVEVLAEVNGKIVAARQGKQLVTAFHPELHNDQHYNDAVHAYFLQMINE